MTRIWATILDPDPIPEGLQELAEIFGIFASDGKDRISFGPCCIASTTIHPAYSYLDLHGHLGGTGMGTGVLDGIQGGEEEDADVDADYDRLTRNWTVIDIPV